MTSPESPDSSVSGDLGLQLFRNLLEHTTDSVYFKDLSSRFIRISARQGRNYGLSNPEEAIGKSDADFFAAEHAGRALRDEQQIIRTGEPMIGKEEMQTWPDGRRTWVSTSKMPLRDGLGRIIGTFGISRDITTHKEAEEALVKSEERLRLAVEAMERELDRARVIQRALLPLSPPVNDLIEIAALYEPLDAIGGDYYSVAPVAGDKQGIFVGDVMGHGVSAALFMALLKFVGDGLVREAGEDPKVLLERLNATLMDQMPMSFATGLYALFEKAPEEKGLPGGAILSLAGAGHPWPLIQRAATGGIELLPLSGNAALGLTNQFQTATERIRLASGDRIYFYTDGVTEASDASQEMLGPERLVDLARQAARPGLQETLEALLDELNRFRGEAALEDDVLLVGVRVK